MKQCEYSHGFTWNDTDKCELDVYATQAECINKFRFSADEVTCTGINECEDDVCHLFHTCTKMNGSFKWEFNSGFIGNEKWSIKLDKKC